MAQRVKALASKPDDPSSIPTQWKKRKDTYNLNSDLYMYALAPTCPYAHKINKCGLGNQTQVLMLVVLQASALPAEQSPPRGRLFLSDQVQVCSDPRSGFVESVSMPDIWMQRRSHGKRGLRIQAFCC